MKSPKLSRDVLYVPLYLRSLSVKEKILVALLAFTSSITVGLIPIFQALINTKEPAKTPIYSSEVELWKVFNQRD